MSEVYALDKESLARAMKERLEDLKDGVVLKIEENKLNIKKVLRRGGVFPEDDLNHLNNGVISFSLGTRIKKSKKQGQKYTIIGNNGKYPCSKDGEYLKVYYKSKIEQLKELDDEEIRVLLTIEVLRRDDAVIFKERQQGTVLDLDPTQEAINHFGSESKAQKKIDKRAKHYRERVDTWWEKTKKKAKKESVWGRFA